MNKENVVKLEKYAQNYLSDKKESGKIKEEEIRKAVGLFQPFIENLTSDEIEQAIKNLESRYRITMDTGAMLKEDNYKKWYFNSRVERGTRHWDRYKRYLEETVFLPRAVIDTIDDSSDEIMDVLGDPLADTKIERKGLVIGAVQSGKTSNYIALMNKAADSGYKVIILLTGTIEKLRQQTQSRVDEGFIGRDSSTAHDQKKTVLIGVGEYEDSSNPVHISPFTTTAKDFNVNTALTLKSQAGVAVFVVKKNKSILEKLEKWLRRQNADLVTQKIELPLLLIDDEADNASINTNDPDQDPTAINNAIRNLLKLFTRYSYVGFTATPFANIFINPQLDKKIRDDLFPKDFIYLLEQPSNYIGPNEMYPDTGRYHYMIRNNDDVEDVLELKHKNNTIPISLPETLEDAILLFFIGNAIRDLRGQNKKHRSMLIHISRFISVQNAIQKMVDDYVRNLKVEIKNYALIDDEESEVMLRLRALYEFEYGSESTKKNYHQKTDKSLFPIKENWKEIKEQLYKSVDPIQVRAVNSGTESKNLNYDEYDTGLRLIAVGGLSLARGLTLEGLMISYFYRNTRMYDTLMQMGRWFGYRDGYEDLCRLWTSEESAGWYAHIAEATEELRMEIRKMANEGKRPDDFGLKVRSSEDAPLIATAQNKMKSTQKLTLKRSLNGQMIETPILSSKLDELQANNKIIEEWFIANKKFSPKVNLKWHSEKPNLKDVPKTEIISLLSLLEFPHLNDSYISSNEKKIIEDIQESNSDIFNKWDVIIASNKESIDTKPVNFADEIIYPIQRKFDFFGSKNFIRMSGSKKRLGSIEYAKAGLTEEQYSKIEDIVSKAQGTKKSPSANMYFDTGIERNPLLVIYPVQLKKLQEQDSIKKVDKKMAKKIDNFVEKLDILVTGIAIGIPKINGVDAITYEYVINMVAQRELLGADNEPDEDNLIEE